MRARAYKRRVSTVAWGLILFAAIACWSLYSAGEQGMYAPQPAKEAHSGELPWNLTLVNRWNPLPEDYDLHLVDVPGGEKVDERIYEPLMAMLEAAEREGLGPFVASGYRTQEKQQSLYDEKIQEYRAQGYSAEEAVRQAQRWVAVPARANINWALPWTSTARCGKCIHGCKRTATNMVLFSAIPGRRRA